MLTNNNLSKTKFKEFLNKNGQFKKAKGNRQVFYLNGEKWCFSISDRAPQCRQFYEDCKGFITLMGGEYYAVRVGVPDKHPWSRTMKDGTRAFSVEVGISDLRRFECA